MAIESQPFFDCQILKVLLLRRRLDRPERRRDDELLPDELLPEEDRRDDELDDELLLAARDSSGMHDTRRITRSQNRRFAQQQNCVKTGLKTIKTTTPGAQERPPTVTGVGSTSTPPQPHQGSAEIPARCW